MEFIDRKINFVFENEDYEVSMEAYDKNKAMRLPDGRVLDVNMWAESYPPQAMGLHLIQDNTRQTTDATVKPKLLDFTYEDQDYCTSFRMYSTGKVLLPNGQVLEAKSLDYQTHSFEFSPIDFDVAQGIKEEKIVIAEHKVPEITFNFAGEDYIIPNTSNNSDYLQLPDGRIFKVDYWLESYPVQPGNMQQVLLMDNFPVCKVEYQKKTVKLTFEDKEYVTTHSVNMAQYVLLPDGKVLEKSVKEPFDQKNPYVFSEVKTPVDIDSELMSQNLTKADLAKPKNKLKM